MTLTSIKKWLNDHLHKMAYVPDHLKAHTASFAGEDNHTYDPWWLAEAIIKTGVDDEEAEGLVLQLLQTIESAVQKQELMGSVCDIVEQTTDLLSFGLRTPTLKNAFNKDNALVTVYYTIVFVMSCAISEDRDDHEILSTVRAHESTILAVATMASKLLINNDVHEFVAEAAATCLSRGRALC